jgi:hypothetical protein
MVKALRFSILALAAALGLGSVGVTHQRPSAGYAQASGLHRLAAGHGHVRPVVYHGGPVAHHVSAYLIFWLPQGYTYEPDGSDDSYRSLIERYFTDVGGTSFYNILTQYADRNGHVQNSVTLGGSWLDDTPYPRAGTRHDPLLDSDIRAEVARQIRAQGVRPGLDTQFFVYTGAGVESCKTAWETQCSFNKYCGYHNSFRLGGRAVLYANLPDNGSEKGCLTEDDNGNSLSPNGDLAADSTINTTSHEQFEMTSDPLLNHPAWLDNAGNEIGDKCDWKFAPIASDGSDIVLNGDPYIVQTEWSQRDHGCVLSD